MRADTASEIARDFAALSGRDRRAILSSLTADQRLRLNALLDGRPTSSGGAMPAVHSAWFTSILAVARDPNAEGPTTAARAALIEALGNIDAPPRASGRSLFQAAGELLAGARAR